MEGLDAAGAIAPNLVGCAFHCLKGLAKFVVVDDQANVVPIANQDFAGTPRRLAPPLVHAHIGHVMIASRDTPGPASGYGAKKAAAGALQHVGFTAAVDNASPARDLQPIVEAIARGLQQSE